MTNHKRPQTSLMTQIGADLNKYVFMCMRETYTQRRESHTQMRERERVHVCRCAHCNLYLFFYRERQQRQFSNQQPHHVSKTSQTRLVRKA